jgi:hypothetical protein
MKTLALDAMGVIYPAGDDVAELLCPFVREHGRVSDDNRIEALYREVNLGRMIVHTCRDRHQKTSHLMQFA